MTVESAPPTVGVALAQIAAVASQVGELKSYRIVAAFEREILGGRLPVGARLPTEEELCDILGVSRSVVRDSVRTLVARGLLNVRQGSGTTVAEPNDGAFSNALLGLLTRFGFSMGEVFDARATIETSLVALAAKNGTSEDWDLLDATYEAFADAVARGDSEEATRKHARFHAGILEAVHQPALALMLKPMYELTLVSGLGSVRRNSPEDWVVEAHLPILAALRTGNADEAVKAMVAHYEVSTRPQPYQEIMQIPFAEAYYQYETRPEHLAG